MRVEYGDVMNFNSDKISMLLGKIATDGVYADIRLEKSRLEQQVVNTGQVETVQFTGESGFGIRVLHDGHWGFAGSTAINDENILEAGKKATKMAKAESKRKKVKLMEVPIYDLHYSFPNKINPADVSTDERIELLMDLDKKMEAVSKTTKRRNSACAIDLRKQLLVTSDGTKISTDVVRTQITLDALAADNGVRQYYQESQGGSRGWEVVNSCDWDKITESVVSSAEMLASATSLGEEQTTIVHDPLYGYLFSHEILGHPAETDRFLGQEAAWAGIAWWSENLGKEVAVPGLNVVDDRTIEGTNGYGLYDDEGVKCSKAQIIKEGKLVGTLHNRETAQIFNSKPTGHTRATRAGFMPLTRMGNLYVENGDWKAEEIIEETKDGVYVVGSRVPSIDQRRYNYQISCMKSWKIRDGEIAEPLRDITIGGVSADVFMTIDAIGNDLQLTGTFPNCGKGMPMQGQYVGNGTPTMRYKATAIGSMVS